MRFSYKYFLPIFITSTGALCPAHRQAPDMEKRVCVLLIICCILIIIKGLSGKVKQLPGQGLKNLP
jgi:hypothetical protein